MLQLNNMDLSFFDEIKASRDNLTNVYARESIVEYINHLIAEHIPFSFLMADVDNFKFVNDTYGHLAGDEILKIVARTLENEVKTNGVVGRFGGDEFMIVFPNIVDYDGIWTICKELRNVVNKIKVQDYDGLYVSATMGISRFPENEQNWKGLLETADKALYRGKIKGRNCFIIYLPEKHANIVLKTEKETALSSMYLHSTVFKQLTENKSFAKGINNILNFLSSYFMIDHLCLQYEDKLLFEKVDQLSKVKEFKALDDKLFVDLMTTSSDYLCINDLNQLKETRQTEFEAALRSQGVEAIFITPIAYQDELFGYLRADLSHKRVWQRVDMDILITTAKFISMHLHDTKTSLEEMVRQ